MNMLRAELNASQFGELLHAVQGPLLDRVIVNENPGCSKNGNKNDSQPPDKSPDFLGTSGIHGQPRSGIEGALICQA